MDLGEHMLTIGNLALRARTSTDTIRFYERMGLVKADRRTDTGYRLYTADTLHRLAFIKHAQRCGLALAEVKALLDATDCGADEERIEEACELARTKKQAIEDTLVTLHAMSGALSTLLSWRTNSAASWSSDECPLLDAFASAMAQHRGDATATAKAPDESPLQRRAM